MEPYIAQITMFAGNFAPRGWAFCNGQLMAIASNTALFSLIGTTYGGDGRTTMGLPDLRGRVPIHAGSGPGLSTKRLGQRAGLEQEELKIVNMPNHTHVATPTTKVTVSEGAANVSLKASSKAGTLATPVKDSSLAAASAVRGEKTQALIYNQEEPNVTLFASETTVKGITATAETKVENSSIGGNQPFSLMQPYLTVNYIIALQGIFPSRN